MAPEEIKMTMNISEPMSHIARFRSLPTVAVLYCRSDSIYKTLAAADVYDAQRDARTYSGSLPVIAHPPCRALGRLRQFANPRKGERALAIHAIRKVRECGGVLEHPRGSTLWKRAGLPMPGSRDRFGGFTVEVSQKWWGHKAEKSTWLYVVGVEPGELPKIPLVLGQSSHVLETRKIHDRCPSLPKREREETPLAFALWLIELALRCSRGG